jgi:hypothetical protein
MVRYSPKAVVDRSKRSIAQTHRSIALPNELTCQSRPPALLKHAYHHTYHLYSTEACESGPLSMATASGSE